MSIKKRIMALEMSSNILDETERPVTFIEMAHGIRDELWRRGKTKAQLVEAHRKLVVSSAKFHEFYVREVLKEG
jgi:hypothetical protein